jgi:hypothetical protein
MEFSHARTYETSLRAAAKLVVHVQPSPVCGCFATAVRLGGRLRRPFEPTPPFAAALVASRVRGVGPLFRVRKVRSLDQLQGPRMGVHSQRATLPSRRADGAAKVLPPGFH